MLSNEIKNMFLPSKEIFLTLKDYINKNANVETYVSRIKIDTKDIVIVFSEPHNVLQSKSTTHDNTIRTLNYNIEIFCRNQKDNYAIANELAIFVCEVMQGYYKMMGGLQGIIPTFDGKNKDSFKSELRFTSNFYPNQNKLF